MSADGGDFDLPLTERGPATSRNNATTLPSITSARAANPSDGIAAQVKSKIPKLPLSGDAGVKTAGSTGDDYAAGYESVLTPMDVTGDMGIPYDLRELLTTLANRKLAVSKDEFRKKAQERVMQQAYLRCLEDMHEDAKRDDGTAQEARKSHQDWRTEVATDKRREKEQQRMLKETLSNQMALRMLRQQEEKLEQKSSVPAFFLGANAGMAPSPLGASYDEQGNMINSRQKINKDLLKQMKQNKANREALRKDTINKERNYLTRLAVEMDLCEAMERSKHLKKQQEMLEQWERDGHIRNLKKLTSYGTNHVKDYIMQNMADTIPPATAGSDAEMASTFSGTKKPDTPSIGAKLNMSIGYDPRKGKTVA